MVKFENRWGMTHCANWTVCFVECFDKADAVLIFGQIPKRTMSTRVKDRIKIIGRHIGEFFCTA